MRKNIKILFVTIILINLPASIFFNWGLILSSSILNSILMILLHSIGFGLIAFLLGLITLYSLKNKDDGGLRIALILVMTITAIATFGLINNTKNSKNTQKSISDNKNEITVISNIQDSEGVTQSQLDMNFLKKLEEYTIARIKLKSKDYFVLNNQPSQDLKISAESNYVEVENIKFAIIRLKFSDNSSAVFIHAIIGNELRRVGCLRLDNEPAPVTFGPCGDKIKEFFGVKITNKL